MPALTQEQRMEFIRIVLETFAETHKVKRNFVPNSEYHLVYKWANRGIPLATVLQGINEAGGKPRTLCACERSVEESIERWGKAMGGLTDLPEAGPLEEPL